MYIREKYVKRIINEINTTDKKVINVHGDKGVGKSYIIQEVKKNPELTENYICGYLDFSQYVGMTSYTMIDALYDMCDFLTAQKVIKLYQFDIADRVDSIRNGRIPYCERKMYDRIDMSSNVSDFMVEVVSEFKELPYVGAGIKLLQAASKFVYKHRVIPEEDKRIYEQYKGMNDEELRSILPLALAKDINEAQLGNPKSILVIVENYDNTYLEDRSSEWLKTLISNTREVKWLFVSRKEMKNSYVKIQSIPVEPMSESEMKKFLTNGKKIHDAEELENLCLLCEGIPLRADRIIEFVNLQKKQGEVDWNLLKHQGYQHIVSEMLRGLSTSEKEILFQLNFARYFDEILFEQLFPGRFFTLYKEWFSSSLFTQIDIKKYCVQNSMREEVADYMNELDDTLKEDCYYNLFRAEYNWFKRAELSADIAVEDIGQHMQSLFIYGNHISSVKEYFECLTEVKNILIGAGYLRNYHNEIAALIGKGNDELDMAIYEEIGILSVYVSDYVTAREMINKGIELAQTHNNIDKKLTFLSVLMNLEYMSPSDEEMAVDKCIRIAEEYIDTLEKNIKVIPYKMYISNLIKARLYLTKQYITKKQYDNAQETVSYILDICADNRKLSALSLYALYGKAQEHMGEIYMKLRMGKEAIDMYEKAVETYQVAEVLQSYWDAEFYLNFGLAYKRISEEYFCMAGEMTENEEQYEEYIEKAIKNMDNAFKKYEQVRRRVPEIIDTYCKMGFAYANALDYLWRDDKRNEQTEKYLADAEKVLEEAFAQMASNAGETVSNREVANAKCIISRDKGKYYWRKGEVDKAEECFRITVLDGENAIKAAPKHPYGYAEAARSYYAYASYLFEQQRYEEAKEYASKGLETIECANKYINNSEGFVNIRKAFEEILEKI